MRSFLGDAARPVGGALVTLVPELPEVPMLNRAVGLGVLEPATEAGVDEALAALDGRTFYVPLAPGAEPDELPAWLEARGLERGYGWAKFSRPATDPPAADTDLRVDRIDASRGDEFAHVVATGYGLPTHAEPRLATTPARPGYECWLALDGDEPAAAAALFVHEDVGWLGFAATLPAFRSRGAQGALLAARIDRARELGCHTVVTETGELVDERPSNSYRNILRSGFELRYVRPNYVRAAPAV